MSRVVLDDHLLRDVLSDDVTGGLARLLRTYEPWTTNLYFLRLCKSVASARGSKLTGAWTQEQRIELGDRLLDTTGIGIVPLPIIAMSTARIAEQHRLSSLGAEAVAAAAYLHAPLAVWIGDDGLNMRSAAKALRVPYRTIAR